MKSIKRVAIEYVTVHGVSCPVTGKEYFDVFYGTLAREGT